MESFFIKYNRRYFLQSREQIYKKTEVQFWIFYFCSPMVLYEHLKLNWFSIIVYGLFPEQLSFISSDFSTSARCLDYYTDLELDESADTKSIKDAYYKLSKQYHPDMNLDDPDALRKFQVRSIWRLIVINIDDFWSLTSYRLTS